MSDELKRNKLYISLLTKKLEEELRAEGEYLIDTRLKPIKGLYFELVSVYIPSVLEVYVEGKYVVVGIPLKDIKVRASIDRELTYQGIKGGIPEFMNTSEFKKRFKMELPNVGNMDRIEFDEVFGEYFTEVEKEVSYGKVYALLDSSAYTSMTTRKCLPLAILDFFENKGYYLRGSRSTTSDEMRSEFPIYGDSSNDERKRAVYYMTNSTTIPFQLIEIDKRFPVSGWGLTILSVY